MLYQYEGVVADESVEEMKIDDVPTLALQGMAGISYLGVTALLGFFPQVLGILPGCSEFVADETKIVHWRALMAIVGPIGFIYFFALRAPSIRLVRVTIAWRLVWVAPMVFYTWLRGGFPLAVFVLVAGLDITVPIMQMAASKLTGPAEVFRAFFGGALPPNMTKNATTQPQLRDWFSYICGWIGFVITFVTTVTSMAGNDFFSPEDSTPIISFAASVAGCYCFTWMWASHTQTHQAHLFCLLLGLILGGVALLWHAAGMPGYMVANLAVWALLATAIHAYTNLWQVMVSPREGPARCSPGLWLILGGLALGALSSVWFAFSSFCGDTCSTLAVNIHGQDLLVVVLAVVTGVASMNLKPGYETTALFVSWLIPMSAVYFTCETKMLAHLRVGTPFHPSWHTRGLAPVWGQAEIVNVTFFIATMLLTAFGSSVACVFVAKCTKCTEGWMRLVLHGALIVFFTGWFMALFITGIPTPTEAMGMKDGFVAPLIPSLNKVDAVAMHIKDLQIGLFLMAAGPVLKASVPEEWEKLSWAGVGVAWFLFLVGKVRLISGVGGGAAGH